MTLGQQWRSVYCYQATIKLVNGLCTLTPGPFSGTNAAVSDLCPWLILLEVPVMDAHHEGRKSYASCFAFYNYTTFQRAYNKQIVCC